MSHSRNRGELATGRETWIEIKAEAVRKRNATYRIQREVEAMRYVQEHTSIPVPYIIEVQLGKGEREVGWFLMERLSGVQLDSAWSSMEDGARARTISQLKSYFAELHALRPPSPAPGWIGSCSKGPAYDHRINNRATCGPFASVKEFHDILMAPAGKAFPDLIPKYRPRLPDDDEIVFAHGDVSYDISLSTPRLAMSLGL